MTEPWVFREVGQIVVRPRDSRRFYLLGKGSTPKEFADVLDAAHVWCEEQFGQCGPIWSRSKLPVHFEFFNDDAAFEFKMRWC